MTFSHNWFVHDLAQGVLHISCAELGHSGCNFANSLSMCTKKCLLTNLRFAYLIKGGRKRNTFYTGRAKFLHPFYLVQWRKVWYLLKVSLYFILPIPNKLQKQVLKKCGLRTRTEQFYFRRHINSITAFIAKISLIDFAITVIKNKFDYGNIFLDTIIMVIKDPLYQNIECYKMRNF